MNGPKATSALNLMTSGCRSDQRKPEPTAAARPKPFPRSVAILPTRPCLPPVPPQNVMVREGILAMAIPVEQAAINLAVALGLGVVLRLDRLCPNRVACLRAQ